MGPLELDRGWAEILDATVEPDSGFDASGCHELIVSTSVLDSVVLGVEPAMTLEASGSEFRRCDLSGATIPSLRSTRMEDCKLTGTDLSTAALQDVVFDRCRFRHVNLRMAKLRRVRFVDCTLDDVDCFELRAEDVEFPGCALDGVNVDRLSAERVDLRSANVLAFNSVGSLAGCLIGEHQVTALAYSLAFAAGAGIERTVSDSNDAASNSA